MINDSSAAVTRRVPLGFLRLPPKFRAAAPIARGPLKLSSRLCNAVSLLARPRMLTFTGETHGLF